MSCAPQANCRCSRRHRAQYRVLRAFKKAGIDGQRARGALVHGLRHTFATQLANSEVSVCALMNLLGHESMSTSKGYVTARTQNSGARVRAAGAAPVVGALSDLEVLRSAASRSDAVIHLAQADSGEADLAAATVMLDGVGAGVYVHTGGTWVYGNTNGVVDETAPWDPPVLVAWRRSVEEAVLGRADSSAHPVIVQPGLLYGGDNRLIEMFYAAPGRDVGYMSHIGDGSNHWALVHVEDIARLYKVPRVMRSPCVSTNSGACGGQAASPPVGSGVWRVVGSRWWRLSR